MTTVIIDYGSGNLHSAKKALERASAQAGLSGAINLTNDPGAVRECERIVLPGVGSFADCHAGLAAIPGLLEALDEAVLQRGKPFLGICVGMQLMAKRGLEHGVTNGLGWIAGDVRAITPEDPALKVPHMGWNTLTARKPHALLAGIPLGEQGQHAYFVHSFQFQPDDAGHVLAVAEYGGPVVAMAGRDNLAGTQFHPEKSQKLGLAFLANFLRWRP